MYLEHPTASDANNLLLLNLFKRVAEVGLVRQCAKGAPMEKCIGAP
jgi:hypothetical protein